MALQIGTSRLPVASKPPAQHFAGASRHFKPHPIYWAKPLPRCSEPAFHDSRRSGFGTKAGAAQPANVERPHVVANLAARPLRMRGNCSAVLVLGGDDGLGLELRGHAPPFSY